MMMHRLFRTHPQDLIVSFGPAIRSCCYEVQKDLARCFPKGVTNRNGRLYLDLIALNRQELVSLGIEEDKILDSNICTCCQNKDFFSFRKEGNKVGRMMSVIMLK
jgi:copper oxidase (laccase) domain-containing protein